MTDQERLETRVNNLEFELAVECHRNARLQQENERLKDYSQKSANVALLAELENENARLRQALEFYADEENYELKDGKGDWLPTMPIDKDAGEKARQVLEEIERLNKLK